MNWTLSCSLLLALAFSSFGQVKERRLQDDDIFKDLHSQLAEFDEKADTLLQKLHVHIQAYRQKHPDAWPEKPADLGNDEAADIIKKLDKVGTFRMGLFSEKDSPTGQTQLAEMAELYPEDVPLIWYSSTREARQLVLTSTGRVLQGVYGLTDLWRKEGEPKGPPEHYFTAMIRYQDNKPVSKAKVIFSSRGLGSLKFPDAETTTDAEGMVKIYVGPDRSPDLLLTVSVEPAFPYQVTLPAAERSARKVIRIPQYASIGGFVVDDKGQPVARAKVKIVQETNLSDGKLSRKELSNAPLTDERGYWEHKGLPINQGDYVFKVSQKEFLVQTYFGDPQASERDESSLALDQLKQKTAKMCLQRPGKYSGRLLDDAGAPLGKVKLNCCSRTTERRGNNSTSHSSKIPNVETDENGNFSVQLPEEGTLGVQITVPGYYAEQISTLTGPTDCQEEIRLKKAAPLRILVVDTLGKPQPGASVSLWNSTTTDFVTSRKDISLTDEDGLFLISSPPNPAKSQSNSISAQIKGSYGSTRWPSSPPKKYKDKADCVIYLNGR